MSTYDRYCEACGHKIPHRNQTILEYAKRRYCSSACANRSRTPGKSQNHPYTLDGHNCARCGTPLVRFHGQSWSAYLRRRYCSNKCRANTPLDTCDCGAPITRHVWVMQLSAEGWEQAACLDLCDACAALVPEGTPEPPAIVDNEYRFREPRRRRTSQTEFADESWHVCHFAQRRWHE